MPDPIESGDEQALGAALQHSRAGSKLYLHMAIQILGTDGVAATLRIHIPTRSNQPIECELIGLNPHPNR